MNNTYIKIPESISFEDIVKKNYTLSCSQYMQLVIPNQNCLFVKDFLCRELQRKDLGFEIGSLNYISQSTHYFIRTKALQANSFVPDINNETALPIMPNVFVNMNLKAGDLLISKDSNIGETVILDEDYPNFMISSAIYRLPIKEHKFYLFAFLKHKIFKEQLDFIVPKGVTIRHAKTIFLDCKIPLPNTNVENTILFIEILVQAIINKEKLIKKRHETILKFIEKELMENQKSNIFEFELLTIEKLQKVGRLDTKLYGEYFKSVVFNIENYQHGFQNIYSLGFTLSRGQNLQISNIGESIYSSQKYFNFYTLMLPKFLSKYGTVEKIEYLGNPNSLKTLQKGDLIFGAEGFEKGRSIVIIEEKERTITNIHGITIQQKVHDINKGIFIKCFLDYLRNKGLIDLYAVGGNGGSLAQKYWDIIPFPNFPVEKQKEITKLYHNSLIDYDTENFNLENFLEKDNFYNNEAGIYELDKTAKQLKNILNQAIDDIANDKEVRINF
ncbi:MAG: hypothetical protein IGQ45_12170 [Cyanobacterium sp. T60_A2020_053]|nr:hypothetical protein [Cyanobacterium sp. T60_A2020_053]